MSTALRKLARVHSVRHTRIFHITSVAWLHNTRTHKQTGADRQQENTAAAAAVVIKPCILLCPFTCMHTATRATRADTQRQQQACCVHTSQQTNILDQLCEVHPGCNQKRASLAITVHSWACMQQPAMPQLNPPTLRPPAATHHPKLYHAVLTALYVACF